MVVVGDQELSGMRTGRGDEGHPALPEEPHPQHLCLALREIAVVAIDICLLYTSRCV